MVEIFFVPLDRATTKEKDTVDSGFTDQLHSSSDKNDTADQSLTSHIGTALYVAPEINNASSKSMYNQVNMI